MFILILSGIGNKIHGQTLLAVQDFEKPVASNNLSFTSTNGGYSFGNNGSSGRPANANLFNSSDSGWQVSNQASTLIFANQSLAGSVNNYVEFRLAGMSTTSTNGIDNTDSVTIFISTDNGSTYSAELSIKGISTGNVFWDFAAGGPAVITYDGNNVPNNYTSNGGTSGIAKATINLPNTLTQVRIKLLMFNNNNAERWVIDDVKIFGTCGQPSFTTQPSSSICNGSNVTYTTQAGQSNYSWNVPGVLGNDYFIVSGGLSATDNTVMLQWLTTGTKNITVGYSPSCPGAAAASNTATVYSGSPGQPGTISQPPGTACENSTGNVYSITPVVGAASYNWSVTGTGWSIASGNGTNAVTVSIGTGSGSLSVYADNACGNGSSQTTGTIVPAADAIAPVASAATLIFNNGFTANWNAVTGATSYLLDIYENAALEDFTDGNFTANPVWSPAVAAFAVNTSTSLPSGAATTDGFFLASNSSISNGTIFTASAEVNEWSFSLGSTNFSPSSPNHFGVVLMASNSVASIDSSFNGYYLRIGVDGINDYIELWESTGLIKTQVGIFPSSPNVGSTALTNGLNIRITRSAVGVFELFYAAGFTYAAMPTVSAGTLTANTYSASAFFGVYCSFVNPAATRRVYIDNISLGRVIYIVQNLPVPVNFYEASGLSPSTVYNYTVRAISACGRITTYSNVISVTTLSGCVSNSSITNFDPKTGPEGTWVSITGSGFSGATAVKFGSLPATSFIVNSNTLITAKAPVNVANDVIFITVGGCEFASSTTFTPIYQTGCGVSSGASANELFISEVYDADTGSLGYVELFNGTSGAVNLSTGNYVLRVITGTSAIADIPLTGSVASGATYVIRVGDNDPNNPIRCGNIFQQTSSSGSCNGNDRIYLRKGGSDIDYIPNPNYGGTTSPGFIQTRKLGAIAPSINYLAADWITDNTESCSNLGIAPYVLYASSTTVSIQPADNTSCSSLNFSVTASGSPGPLTYLWRYYNTSSGTWQNVNTLPTNGPNAVTIANPNTATLNITGNTGTLYAYQFYCEISNGGCVLATNAVRYTYTSRPYYKSKQAGNWSNPNIWLISNSSSDWSAGVVACGSPNKDNSSAVYIDAAYPVVLDQDVSVDFLQVNAGAVFTIAASSKLIISDSTVGADFVVSGTWIYSADSAHSFDGDVNATWILSAVGTIIKTNDGSAVRLRDIYEGGMTNMPAAANWILRYDGTNSNVTFCSNTDGGFGQGVFYPNLTFESTAGAWTPVAKLYGNNQFTQATIKGSLDIGGTGSGTVTGLIDEHTSGKLWEVRGALIVRAGSSLTNAGGNAPGNGFEIWGNIQVDGTLNIRSANSGILRVTPSSSKTISGSGFISIQDLTIGVNQTFSSANPIALNKSTANDVNVFGTLTLEDGMNLTMTAGSIALKSSATATARFTQLGTGTFIYSGTGRFIVERYIQTGRKWQLLSIPTTDAVGSLQTINQAWQEGGLGTTSNPRLGYGTVVTSNLSNWSTLGFDTLSLGGPSMKSFNGQSKIYDPVTNTSAAITNNKGYFLFVRGDRTALPSNTINNPTILRTRGYLKTGAQTISLPDTGFHGIGNPYASQIDFRSITRNNVPNSFYLWDSRLAGSYAVGGFITCSYNSSTLSYDMVPPSPTFGSTNNSIESGQAFFVRVSAANGSIVFNESAKSTGNRNVFRPQQSVLDRIRINLYSTVYDPQGILVDGCMIDFDPHYDNRLDDDDIIKFNNNGENVGIISNGRLLAVEKRKQPVLPDTLQIFMDHLRAGTYKLEVNCQDWNLFGKDAFVYDTYLNQLVPLQLGVSNFYDFSVNTDTKSSASGRLRIVFDNQKGSPFISFSGRIPDFFQLIN